MTQRINVALASYGMSGRVFHAPFLEAHPYLHLTKILERSKSDSAARYPNARICRNFSDLLTDPDIDLIVVNTPNALHYPMAKAALEAGKHVVVEKPFTTTVDEGRELIALAREKQLILSVYHNRRLQSGIKTARKLLAENAVGELRSYEMTIDRFRPQPGPKKWKEETNPGAGLLYDLGSHLIDEALTLFGLPQSVSADLRIERPQGQVCDYFRVCLDYGAFKAVLKGSMLAREPAPAYVIHGTQGSYVKYAQDVQEARLAEGVIPNTPHWADEDQTIWGVLHNDQGRHPYPSVAGSYQDYYNNIYRHLTEDEPLLVSADQALVVVGMIAVAERSAREQATIILQ